MNEVKTLANRSHSGLRACVSALCLCAVAVSAADDTTQSALPEKPAAYPEDSAGAATEETAPPDPCAPVQEGGAWLDRFQRGVHSTVCGTAEWFDRFFGETGHDRLLDETYGRLGLGFEWDERDGFDPQVRMRAKLALPAMENRLGILIGRGDEDELVEDRSGSQRDALPSSVRDVRDDDWLLGLGYTTRPGKPSSLDFRVGARLGFPIEPYAKGIWRWRHSLGELSAIRLRETLFWRAERGFGETTHVEIDRLLGEPALLRWSNTATLAEDVEGLEWESSLGLYQNLSPRRALVYTALVRGETDAEISLRNYGVELRYRQRVARQWLFVELLTSVTWPRETRLEEREANFGIGIGFEMYFGRTPEHAMP